MSACSLLVFANLVTIARQCVAITMCLMQHISCWLGLSNVSRFMLLGIIVLFDSRGPRCSRLLRVAAMRVSVCISVFYSSRIASSPSVCLSRAVPVAHFRDKMYRCAQLANAIFLMCSAISALDDDSLCVQWSVDILRR